jgi:hypothetical protein
MSEKMNKSIKELISQMTLEEKESLCSDKISGRLRQWNGWVSLPLL